MTQRILLSADIPCDIGPQLADRYRVSLFPLHILLGHETYTDGLDITNEEIYRAWREKGQLPRTAAINPEEYIEYFRPFLDDGYEIIHVSLGSGISCTHQNAVLAAEEFPGRVHVIDSKSLSAGCGLLVCEAGERIAAGMAAKEIVREVEALVPNVSASFVMDTLEFMHAGGRCSNFTQLSAALMRIKPGLVVLPDRGGSMMVGKKYIGSLERALRKYTEDQLKGRTDIVLDRAFVTHTCGSDSPVPAAIRELVLQYQPFSEVLITDASCTIGAHCGPGTLGVLFLTKTNA